MGTGLDVAYGSAFVARKSNLVHRIYCLDIFEPSALLRVAGGLEIAGVVADPPYASGGNTGSAKRRDVNEKYSTEKIYLSFHNDHMDQATWLEWSRTWIRESFAVASPGAMLLVFVDWRQSGVLQTAVQLGGWIYRGLAVWNKTESSRPPYPSGGFRHQGEFVVWASKGKVGSHGGKPQSGVLSQRIDRQKVHIHQKPVEVYRWLLRGLFRPGLVLDPFAGSLSLVLASEAEGRESVAVEMSPEILSRGLDRLAGEGFEITRAEGRYELFLKNLSEGKSLRVSAELAGLTRQAVYERMRRDSGFGEVVRGIRGRV